MLYRETLSNLYPPGMPEKVLHRPNVVVGSPGGGGHLVWMRGRRVKQACPVCSDQGPHQLQLSVPSSIIPSHIITFARCRRCDSRFVTDFQEPAYEQTSADKAPLHFYIEQGAGIDYLARCIFTVAQKPVQNYLDIGCGFGFGPDMATRIFGWRSLGLDPGPLAAAGREMLGIQVEGDLLGIERDLADAPYDAVVATEVIEHIANPHEFVRAIRRNIADTGILVLSTPNGRYLDTCSNDGMLLPILSPGHHAVLYNQEALVALLRQGGFSNVHVVPTFANLFAIASPSMQALHTDVSVQRERFVGYLSTRFRDSPSGSSIHIGFGYRLMRALVEDQAYREALDAFVELREAILARLDIDIARPLDIASRVLEQKIAFTDIPDKYPFCIAGLLYYRGTIAARHEQRDQLAAVYFLAAYLSAHVLLGALNAIGMGDGELSAQRTLAAEAIRPSLIKTETNWTSVT